MIFLFHDFCLYALVLCGQAHVFCWSDSEFRFELLFVVVSSLSFCRSLTPLFLRVSVWMKANSVYLLCCVVINLVIYPVLWIWFVWMPLTYSLRGEKESYIFIWIFFLVPVSICLYSRLILSCGQPDKTNTIVNQTWIWIMFTSRLVLLCPDDCSSVLSASCHG